MTDTIAGIRARHEAAAAEGRFNTVGYISSDHYNQANADRAALLARVAELEAALSIKDNKERLAFRYALGGVSLPWMLGDNLAIILCSVLERLSSDDEEEGENGWKDTTVEQCDATVDAAVNAVLQLIARQSLKETP